MQLANKPPPVPTCFAHDARARQNAGRQAGFASLLHYIDRVPDWLIRLPR